MIKDPLVFIEHIWESIELIEGYLRGKNANDFLESIQLQDAVIRRLEIMGEAVKNIPEDYIRKYPELPWNQRYLVKRFAIRFSEKFRELLSDWDGRVDTFTDADELVEKIFDPLIPSTDLI